jgi:hypothetical protein
MMKSILGMTVAKSYSRLFSDLRLTPEHSATLEDLILEKRLAELDAPHKEKTQEIKAKEDELNDRIKQLLGNEKYAHFQDYEKTASQRLAVSTYEDQLASNSALTPDQEQQLIKAMAEENWNARFTADGAPARPTDDSSLPSQDSSRQQLQQQEQLNQRYLTRAQQILSPDQLAAFEKYLVNQQKMMAAMAQMTAKMFATKTNN